MLHINITSRQNILWNIRLNITEIVTTHLWNGNQRNDWKYGLYANIVKTGIKKHVQKSFEVLL